MAEFWDINLRYESVIIVSTPLVVIVKQPIYTYCVALSVCYAFYIFSRVRRRNILAPYPFAYQCPVSLSLRGVAVVKVFLRKIQSLGSQGVLLTEHEMELNYFDVAIAQAKRFRFMDQYNWA